MNAWSQTESLSDVGGVAKTVDSTGTYKAAFDFEFLQDVSLVSIPAAKVNTVGKC